MNEHPDPAPGPSGGKLHDFVHRVTLVYGVGLLFLLVMAGIWYAADALLLIFACVLFAILLFKLSELLAAKIHLRRKFALPLVVLLLVAAIGLGGWLMAPQIADQSDKLSEAVPHSLGELRAALSQYELPRRLMSSLPSDTAIKGHLAKMVPNAGLFFTGIFGALGNVLIILFVGIYFAIQPYLYIDGFITLVPQRKRARAREIIAEIGQTLSKWLVGKAITMLVVGVVTSIGLTVLGVPLALILGIIAGLLDFIPYLGPLMAGVPAVLIAFSDSPTLALYTAGLFAAIQLLEGYLLEPYVDKRAVSLPPALTIVMQVLFGTLFGLAGVALATPLTAVIAVLVTMLYVQDVLGDAVRKPSELQ